jgi:hypothetical protein
VAGPDNWDWKVQVSDDPLSPGMIKRFITRKSDGAQSMKVLCVIVRRKVVSGQAYEGDFNPHYYLQDGMPDELMKEFEASRKALVVAQVPQGAAGATGAEAAALGAEQGREGDQPVLGTGAQQEPEVHEEAQQAEHGERHSQRQEGRQRQCHSQGVFLNPKSPQPPSSRQVGNLGPQTGTGRLR